MATQWPQPVLQHGRLTMYHNTPDHYVWLAQHTAGYHQTTTCLRTRSRRSLQRAPTQRPKLSVRPASHPNGPNLLLFGCAASVWSYIRFGDVLTALSRVLTATPAVHFVDDYGSIQPQEHSQDGFDSFGRLNSTLGFHMKHSKEQPPQTERKIQGVYISLTADAAIVPPCPQRIQHTSSTAQGGGGSFKIGKL